MAGISKATKFCATTVCDQCPWRKDAPHGLFSRERFDAMRTTVGDGDAIRPIFACHKAPEGHETACVGYLMVCGWTNIVVRVAAAMGRVDPKALRSPGPLFESFDEMYAANVTGSSDF